MTVAPSPPAEFTYDVDLLNQGESVHVVPNLSSTTVSLDPSTGGWLVDSTSRRRP